MTGKVRLRHLIWTALRAHITLPVTHTFMIGTNPLVASPSWSITCAVARSRPGFDAGRVAFDYRGQRFDFEEALAAEDLEAPLARAE